MTPDVLAARVDTIISKTEAALISRAKKTQVELFDQMSVLLNKLTLDEQGNIIQNQANRSILAKSNTYFNKGMGEYYDSLNSLPNTIANITTQNALYFETVLESFTPSAQYIKSLQTQTVLQAESLLANEGIELALKQPITSILNQNINTSAAYSDLVKQLRTFILGNDQVEGTLLRYSKQIVTDTLFNYNRAMQEAVSANSGLEWTQYIGGAMDTSRDFCISKLGGYYPKNEVEKWASQSWAGKRPGTTSSTIFIYAGGYNCRHQIIYVHESVVPQTNKDSRLLMKQAKETGNELQDEAAAIAKKNGAKITPVNYKGYDSMVRKAKDETNGHIFLSKNGEGIKDSVRTTIITDGKNLKNVAGEVRDLKQTTGLKIQDFKESGYRGYLATSKLSNGVLGEIQVNTPEMIFAKEQPSVAKLVIGEDKWNAIQKQTGQQGGLGHKYYEEIRVEKAKNPNGSKLIDDLNQKSRDYYANFYFSYPTKWP